ncbi:hypothetical protein RSOLAG22IIIB_00815 [Rhizoctonia solani]|uniref:Uncharacterized protein n=1 Tax=Rhizoctonia solani TaxID=456999 RepID=A0A0K6G1L6_9AGAM|nr:hypothetical protein RSOLAG22IIIB_00815 [Rhizoctonia solani]
MAQIDNLSQFSATCWVGCIPGVSMCDQCPRAGANSTSCAAYITQSDARSTATENGATSNQFLQTVSSNFRDFTIPFSFSTSERTSSDGSSGSSGPKVELVFSEMFHEYTPPTVPESPGRTPAPIATPQGLSFSHQLAYIDEKLIEIAASRRNDTPTERYVTPRPEKRPAQSDSFVEPEQARLFAFPSHPVQLAAPRRTHSKITREKNDYTPPEPQVSHEREHDAKRRKLRKNESTSAHTFAAAEPASLRKAKSLVAGDVNEIPRLPPVTSHLDTVIPPMAVPTIWPREAALLRLRCLIQREADQRAEDARLRMVSLEQRSSSVKFDAVMHFDLTNWILTVKAPTDHEYKSIRRHLCSHLETRFHAVLLFSRYATRMSSSTFNPFLVPRREVESQYQRRVRQRLVKEIALGCLAISVKFHRDFLPPLSPIPADRYLNLLGEDHPVSFDDFELVQSTIMRSFGYILYQPTPQAYIQELWNTCPTLQSIQDGSFELHRAPLQMKALELLQACFFGKLASNFIYFNSADDQPTEYESINYAIAYLTAAAVLEAIHVQEMHLQCRSHSHSHVKWEAPHDNRPRVCAACVHIEICAALQINLVRPSPYQIRPTYDHLNL